jgi:phage-related protein (TIGR01555 family)
MSKHGKRPQQPNQTKTVGMTPGQMLAQAAGGAVPQGTKNIQTTDSFNNFTARLGIQQQGYNQMSDSYYNLGPFISRNRLELEAMYRSSWLIGQVVDVVAEDMTREGLSMYSEMKPDDIAKMQVSISEFGIWQDICSTIKWGRLYGGAIAVILIDGAKYDQPMDIERIRKDQFKGLVVLDRWMIQPSMGELITDICKDIGKPKYYEVLSGVSTFPSTKIHYSRVIRFDGIELPYYQKLFENLWGLSVVERMLDRLIAFDSATTGAAQLLYKAYLRVIGIDGLREALATGGAEENAVIKQFQYIRSLQSNEGITVLDGKDTFQTHQYSFGGVSDMLQQFGQQISGAVGIPLVRLFGQSPAGLSATGESDLRNYYDKINKDQENQIRPQMDKLLAVMAKSVLGYDLPEDFRFAFLSLWQLSETEKSQIAATDVNAVAAAFGGGLITKVTALKELKQQSEITGRFTNITEDDIKDAENEPPMFGGMEDFSEEESSNPNPEGEQIENEDPNERLGGANPDLEKEKGGEQVEEPVKKSATDSVEKMRFRDKMERIWQFVVFGE